MRQYDANGNMILETDPEENETHYRYKATAHTIAMTHPYLTAKGITDPAVISGIRQNEYNDSLRLQIPVFYDGQLYNLQPTASNM